GEPRPITAIEPDRVLEKTYCFSRSPGFAQSKCKFYAIGYRVWVSLQKSRVGRNGFVRTSLRTQDGSLQPQKPLRAWCQRTRPVRQAASAGKSLLAIFLFAEGQNWQNDLPRQHDHQLRRRRLELQSAFQSRYIGGRPGGTQGLMVQ